MSITTQGRAFFRAGVPYDDEKVGYETATGASRVVRYSFTTPSDGVSGLSFRGLHLAHGASYAWQGLGFYISTSPTAYIGATPATQSMGTLSIKGEGGDYSFSAPEVEINLPADTTAYIFIFPRLAQYFMWSFINVGAITIDTKPGSSAISAITGSVATLGMLTVSVSKAVEAFRHRLSVTASGATLHTSEPFDSSYSVVVPRTWFEGFPAVAEIEATATVTTYKGDAVVGAPASAPVTITADAGMRPEISEGWATAAPYNAGAVAGLTGYIAGYSQAEISFDASKLTQAAGAALASVTVACGGTLAELEPYRTGVLIGAADVLCTATDSRGRTATQSIRIEPMDYAPPALSKVAVVRCTAEGTEAEDGSHYKAQATATISSLEGQNTVTLTVAHRVQGGAYGAEQGLSSGEAAVIGGISPDSTYQVGISARDRLGNAATAVVTLPTRQWALKFRADGLGAAFGKAPEHSKAIELPADWALIIGDKELNAERLGKLLAMLTS